MIYNNKMKRINVDDNIDVNNSDVDRLGESILSIDINAIHKSENNKSDDKKNEQKNISSILSIELTAIELQNRINLQYCSKTYDALSDIALQKEYVKTKGFVEQNRKLEAVLKKHLKDAATISNILVEYTSQLVSPSIKATVRGAKFNRLVKEFLLNLNLPKHYSIQFEKSLEQISERPDWYIKAEDEKSTKTLIGMNQMDLWGGGHQINRGDKYINKTHLSNGYKLICVVCNKIDISNKRKTTKVFQIVEKGIRLNTICYLGGLKKIIYDYFDLNAAL